jgi:hypothetical protein
MSINKGLNYNNNNSIYIIIIGSDISDDVLTHDLPRSKVSTVTVYQPLLSTRFQVMKAGVLLLHLYFD